MLKRYSFYTFILSWLWLLCLTTGFSSLGQNLSEKLPPTHLRTAFQNSDLFDRIAETADSVRDLSAQVDFKVRLYNMGLTFNLDADVYYKQPDKVRLMIHALPEFLAKRQTEAYRTANILAGLRRNLRWQYDARIINEASFEGEDCYVIQLIPKTDDGISRIFLWVNHSNYTIPRVILYYQDGSSLTQQKIYVKEDNVYVVKEVDSNYNAPDMKAEILATFRNYRINKGVADGVFDHQKPENNPVNTF